LIFFSSLFLLMDCLFVGLWVLVLLYLVDVLVV